MFNQYTIRSLGLSVDRQTKKELAAVKLSLFPVKFKKLTSFNNCGFCDLQRFYRWPSFLRKMTVYLIFPHFRLSCFVERSSFLILNAVFCIFNFQVVPLCIQKWSRRGIPDARGQVRARTNTLSLTISK